MNKNITKVLSVVLVAIMLLVAVPFVTSAASDVEQITSLDQLTTGKYVIATDKGYAMGVIDGTWVTAQKVTATNGKITGVADSLLWEVTVSGSSVTLKDNNGVFLAPKGGNSNGIATKSYQWNVTVTNGKFVFAGTGSDTVYLASNATEQYAIKEMIQDSTAQILAGQRAAEMREMQNKIDNLRDERTALQLSASQQAQTANIINQIKPCPIPAYITCNPYDSYTPFYGYGNGYVNGGCCA